jgi:SAM-dependent methyltransferase
VDAADLAWLRTDAGLEATHLATALLAVGSELPALHALSRDHGGERARATVELVLGRRTASTKFPDAERLFCDRAAAEQTSHNSVAGHAAVRFSNGTYVADLGCGMGGDALAIAAVNPHIRILAVDRDPARLAMLSANAEVRGVSDRIEGCLADLDSWEPPPDIDAVWCDPGRREADGRRLRPETWSPPLSRAIALASMVPAAGIKLAPGIDLSVLPADGEVEFVSLGRGLRAAVLWLGRLARSSRTATVLPAGESLSGEPDRGDGELGDPGEYLYDCDPAVGRAGLVQMLAASIGAWKLDAHIAYLTSDTAVDTPFARRLRVATWLPFAERGILDALREYGAGRVEVTRRGSPVDTNALELRLNRALNGDKATPPLVVVLTRMREKHIALVCERDAAAAPVKP